MAARYDRAVKGQGLIDALRSGGALEFLLRDLPIFEGEINALDVQLREHNQIMYYHGTTRLLLLKLKTIDGQISLQPDASTAYKDHPDCATAFRRLAALGCDAPETTRDAFLSYLTAALAVAGEQYFSNHKEGYWQNQLCVRFGRDCLPDDDWMVIDRECVIGFENADEKEAYYTPILSERSQIRTALQQHDSTKWGQPTAKPFGDELDLLALDSDGHLLAIELKHGTNASGIYWAPLQASAYGSAFERRLPEIAEGIRDLVVQKVELGLLPEHVLTRVGDGAFASVTPILAIADVKAKSGC